MGETKKTKKKPVHRKNCGSVAGYGAHSKHGEAPCEECAEARREYNRARYAGQVKKREESKTAKQRKAEKEGEKTANKAHQKLEAIQGKYPQFLQAAGRDLWDQITGSYDLGPGDALMLAEACRLADRQARMAAALANPKTLWFELDDSDLDDDEGRPVVVNNMIGESRQLTGTLRQTLDRLGVLKGAAEKAKAGSVFDQLGQRRKQRLAAAPQPVAGEVG